MAFRDGKKNDEAFVGAMMIADGLDAMFAVREYLIATGKGRK